MWGLVLVLAYFRFYFQGMLLGLRHFGGKAIHAAGLKRAVGFILQPVENWSRYPEFWQVDRLLTIKPGEKVLDIGSPKMFSLLLAKKHEATFHLTDIWPTAVREIEQLWEQNRDILKGNVVLETADATQLVAYADEYFDHVYSISVLEHIESLDDFARSLEAIARVLKPKGRLVVSVPVQPEYQKKYMNKEVYGKKHQDKPVFFQHEFDASTLLSIFVGNPRFIIKEAYLSFWPSDCLYMTLWQRVPQKIRGLLGFLYLPIALVATSLRCADPQNLNIDQQGDIILLLEKQA